ncbi:unnamed protein product [Phytophthora fragariaefolia]|uniref:Unnamed protein product n=1 Tax=Phytophthora fragariaefolia TaxID=1490495 RepID=A0A9W7DAX0_9STRA|nr:unnamed protein product [Phytophthora fragariaefolia]
MTNISAVSTHARSARSPVNESTPSTPGVDTSSNNEHHTQAGRVVNKDADLNTKLGSKAMVFVQRRQAFIRCAFQPWWTAVVATSAYVASRMSMANPNNALISEWNLVRLGPSTAADVTGSMVPPSSLSPRECAALTQTLFFEAGFSLFGTTIADSDESNFSGVWGSRSSGKYSSSSSSMWSFGGAPAGTHMPYAGETGMVLTVQGAAFQDASSVGVQMTETILPVPPVLVDQDNVFMSESGRASTRSGHRSRTSHRLHRPRKGSPSEPSSDSGSDTEDRRSRWSSKNHSRSSKRPSKSKRPPSRSVKSEWTERSKRSVRSEMSGASQVALNTMRSTQEALARMESARAQQSERLHQAFQVIQALAAQASSKEERITQAVEAQAHTSEQTPARPTRTPVTQPPAT